MCNNTLHFLLTRTAQRTRIAKITQSRGQETMATKGTDACMEVITNKRDNMYTSNRCGTQGGGGRPGVPGPDPRSFPVQSLTRVSHRTQPETITKLKVEGAGKSNTILYLDDSSCYWHMYAYNAAGPVIILSATKVVAACLSHALHLLEEGGTGLPFKHAAKHMNQVQGVHCDSSGVYLPCPVWQMVIIIRRVCCVDIGVEA